MNTLTKVVVLLVVLMVASSFSHDSIPVQSSDKTTIDVLRDAETFYSNSFTWLLAVMGIVIAAAVAILVFLNITIEKRFVKYVKMEIQEELKTSLENDKTEIMKELKTDRDNNQESIDNVLRTLSRVGKKLADEKLEESVFDKYFYYMYIFYRCLMKIKKLDDYDFTRLKDICDSLSTLKEKTTTPITLGEDNFYQFVIYLLRFGNRFVSSGDDIEKKCFKKTELAFKTILTMEFDDTTLKAGLKEELRKYVTTKRYGKKEVIGVLSLANEWIDTEADE